MPSSGTFTFGLSNASVVLEAFDRIGKRPVEVDRHMLQSARTSLNLTLVDFEDAGMAFWKIVSGVIPLSSTGATYTLPVNLVTLEEMFYSQVNGLGAGVNSDRQLVPMQRTEYSYIVNKLQPGIPTRYWFQMLPVQQVTLWEVPTPASGFGAPNYQLGWYGLQQFQDANIAGGETPDVPRRALDCLCAKLALRLAEKFGPDNPQAKQAIMLEKKALADDSWNKLQYRDNEPGAITIRPMAGIYGRLYR